MLAGASSSARPLTDFVTSEGIPLAEFLPINDLAVLNDILVSDAWTSAGPDNFTLGADFHLPAFPSLNLPGLEQIWLRLGGDAPAEGLLVIGADSFLSLRQLRAALVIDRSVLSTEGGNAEI